MHSAHGMRCMVKMAQRPRASSLEREVSHAITRRIGPDAYRQLRDYIDMVAQHESWDRNVPQAGGGPAFGPWQIESRAAGGSDTLGTMSNRLNALVPGNPLSFAIRRGIITSPRQIPVGLQRTLVEASMDRRRDTNLAQGFATDPSVYASHPYAVHPLDAWHRYHWQRDTEPVSRSPALRRNMVRWYGETFPNMHMDPRHLETMTPADRRTVFSGRPGIGAVTGVRTWADQDYHTPALPEGSVIEGE